MAAGNILAVLSVALISAVPASARISSFVPGAPAVRSNTIAVAPNGDVLAGDSQGGVVRRYAAEGVLRSSFGARGAADGQFAAGPTDIAIDDAGLVYVADGTRVQVFSASGTFVRSGAASAAFYLAVSGDGSTIYSSGDQDCVVHRLNSTLTEVGNLTVDCPDPNGIDASIPGPVRLAVDADGALWVAGPTKDLRRLSPAGVTTSTIPFGPSAFNARIGFALDRERNQFYAWGGYTSDQGITRLTPRSAASSAIRLPVTDVAVSSDGVVYAASSPGLGLLRIDSRPAVGIALASNESPPDPLVASSPFQLSAKAIPSFDPIARAEWDLNGDGTFETPASALAAAQVDLPGQTVVAIGRTESGVLTEQPVTLVEGTHIYAVRVADSAGNSQVANVTVDVPSNRPQVGITGPKVVLTGSNFTLDASRTSVRRGSVSNYEWDRDGDGTFEFSTEKTPVLPLSLTRRGLHTFRLRATGSDGEANTAEISVEARLAPPKGRPGVSINNGANLSRRRAVTLSLVWPPFVRAAVVSNDGSFRHSRTILVRPSVKWTLPRRAAGQTSVVYVRFLGAVLATGSESAGADLTFSDDIIVSPRRRRR